MTRLVSILTVVLVLSACDDDDDDLDDIIDDDGVIDDVPDTFTWSANLAGIGIYSALSGQAAVIQGADAQAFSVTASIRNDIAGSVRPWHVHFGTCGSGGAIVGADTAYPRFIIGADGTAAVTVRVALALDPAEPYHVNVHLADAELETIIACGDLILE